MKNEARCTLWLGGWTNDSGVPDEPRADGDQETDSERKAAAPAKTPRKHRTDIVKRKKTGARTEKGPTTAMAAVAEVAPNPNQGVVMEDVL